MVGVIISPSSCDSVPFECGVEPNWVRTPRTVAIHPEGHGVCCSPTRRTEERCSLACREAASVWRGMGRILAAVAVVSWAASTALPVAEATPPGEARKGHLGG